MRFAIALGSYGPFIASCPSPWRSIFVRIMPEVKGIWQSKGKTGAAEGTRTPDPIITNDVLYQLSYCGDRCG